MDIGRTSEGVRVVSDSECFCYSRRLRSCKESFQKGTNWSKLRGKENKGSLKINIIMYFRNIFHSKILIESFQFQIITSDFLHPTV